MAQLTATFDLLPKTYIFPLIEEKKAAFKNAHPDKEILKLGVGDVSLPLLPQVADAISHGVEEMTKTPIGYGPETGYDFLKEAICENEYAKYGLKPDEIIITDGANGCVTALLDLFSEMSTVAAAEPSYPLYSSAALLGGRKVLTLHLDESTGFLPKPPETSADLVFLCTPGNPTGVAMSKQDLAEWIRWAQKHNALLILDNVYNGFATDASIPDSIYELDGGREVAIEIRSFSKMAGFTGLRCGYMTVPRSLHVKDVLEKITLQMSIKTNGVSYPIQKGAAACFKPDIYRLLKEQVAIYQSSAELLCSVLEEKKQMFFGGKNAPYIFWKIPDGQDDWAFFDRLLHEAHILGIPGIGFGPSGKGYFRLSAFLSNQLATKAQYALRAFL